MSNWTGITADELLPHIKEWNIVDIRDPVAFEQGHIPGAFHLTNDNVYQYIHDHDFTTPIVAVCYVGNSSRGAAEVLANAGFETVYSLEGGMAFWRTAHPDVLDFSEN
jgi:thiosulfate sulfurtransferase